MKIRLVLLFFLPFVLNAQSDVYPLWPDGIPCKSNLVEEIEEMNEIGRAIKKVQEPELVAYLPERRQGNGTAVIICPGGGYSFLAWDWEGILMAEWLQQMGVAAFVLKSRLPHWEHEACRDQVALLDAQRAIRLVRSRAEEWQLQADRIGIMGFSAGGHLAAMASTQFDAGLPNSPHTVNHFSSRPDFSILMYPVITMDSAVTNSYTRNNLLGPTPSEEQVLRFSADKLVTDDTPPTILIHAHDDVDVIPENSIRYYQALRKHQIPASLHLFESGGHGFSFAKKSKESVKNWPKIVEAWMRDHQWLGTDDK